MTTMFNTSVGYGCGCEVYFTAGVVPTTVTRVFHCVRHSHLFSDEKSLKEMAKEIAETEHTPATKWIVVEGTNPEISDSLQKLPVDIREVIALELEILANNLIIMSHNSWNRDPKSGPSSSGLIASAEILRMQADRIRDV